MHANRSYGADTKWTLTFAGDLELEDMDLSVSHDMSSSCADHLCKAISKSIHAYRSYRTDTKWPLTFTGDLDLEDTDPGISRDTKTSCEDHLCQASYGAAMKWPLTFNRDLDLEDTDPSISHDTSSSCEDHLCEAISKSMHACRSYRADTKWPLTFASDLDIEDTDQDTDLDLESLTFKRQIIRKALTKIILNINTCNRCTLLYNKTLYQFLANDLELDFATSELFHMFIKIINMNIKDEKKNFFFWSTAGIEPTALTKWSDTCTCMEF